MLREAENISPKLNKIFILFSLLYPAKTSFRYFDKVSFPFWAIFYGLGVNFSLSI